MDDNFQNPKGVLTNNKISLLQSSYLDLKIPALPGG